MDHIAAATTEFLGAAPTSVRPLHGGDLSAVALVTLDDGRTVVAKSGPKVATEARMLHEMAHVGAPVPRLLGFTSHVMLMEALDEAAAGHTSWRTLGTALATLHRHIGDHYGWPEDYAFGAVAIDNRPIADWPGFWIERRLLAGQQDISHDIAQRLDTLAHRLPDLLPKHPLPALLHGDLWVGNVLFGPAGAVHLIDPACYHGDPEVDLAMLHLFGTPEPGFTEAYGTLPPGWEERRAVYTLWPALVHLRLFGAGYRGMVTSLLDRLGV